MFNAASKPLAAARALLAAGAVALLATSCSGGAEQKRAEALLAQADSAATARNYPLALALLDTLRSRHPSMVAQQRQAMALRPRVEEGQAIREIEQTDSLSAYAAYRIDSIMPLFTLVHNPSLGSDYDYYVVKELAKSTLFARTGVEGRVEPSGVFKVLSSLTAKPVKHTSIALSSTAGMVETAAVAYDGERNYRSGGTEMITFIGADCDTLGCWLNHAGAQGAVKLAFKGAATYSTPLAANDRRSLAEAWKLASFLREQRRLAVKRDFLERKLALARDQMARTAAPAATEP